MSVDEIYIGVAAHESLALCSSSERTVIPEYCRPFYIEVIAQIKSRFYFSDEVYTIVDIVIPKIAQCFQPKSIFLF